MLEKLKKEVLESNLMLKKSGLIVLTWGNVSAIDRAAGLIVIKPSGVDYDKMDADDMAVVDLDGKQVEGRFRPSSDTPTHIALYRAFPRIGGVAHTHSRWATVFAQCARSIPPLGTTHADLFYGEVPCTRRMSAEEIAGDYEAETGKVIVEAVKDPSAVPAALVCSHGPFTWGDSAKAAVEASITLEDVAMTAWHTLALEPHATFQQELADRHYFRKHGKDAYYGQK